MIANDDSRGKGVATEAVSMMMEYAERFLNVSKFVVKIGADNEASLHLFRKLGFDQFEHIEVFDEMHGLRCAHAVCDPCSFEIQELRDILV